MKLLLVSNSTNYGESYLQHALPKIKNFLKNSKIENGIFIPYAAVTFSYDDYEKKVKENFAKININITSIHRFENHKEALQKADLIVVGGGNTFRLLQLMQQNDLLEVIREKVKQGTPYIGWSAGSNVACPTIRTTNDMPIVEPENFNALNLVKFQINPHYTDKVIPNHGGETRKDRLMEFIELNRDVYVIGLREGTALYINDNKIKLIGEKSAIIFKYGQAEKEVSPNDDLQFLME